MSKKFLTPIKLAQGASNPAVGSAGELFFNTTDVKVYAHNGTSWVPSGGGVTVSATAPATPIAGDAWYDTVDGTLYVYYNDGDSSQWVEVAANSGISVALEGRVGVVETYVTTLQSEMDAAQSDIDAIEGRATILETRATALELADSTTNKSGLVPIIPSSVSVGSGSASVNLDGTVSFSGVTTLQMNGLFSDTYDNYQMIVNVTGNTATSAVQGTLVAEGVRSTSGYNNVVTVGDSNNTTVTASAINASSFGTLEVHVSSNTNLGMAEILFVDPFKARRTKMPFVGTGSNAGGFIIRRNGFASHTVASSYDGFHLNVASGNITGTLKVYGYR